MSKGIPTVKTWKVSYVSEKGKVLAFTHVDTINKRFAKWLASERIGYPLRYTTLFDCEYVFVKVGLIRKKGAK